MKRVFAVAVVLLSSAFVLAQSATPAAQTPAPKVIVIRAGNLLDPRSGQMLHNQTIVIRGNKVESVGGTAPADADVIDLSHATVLPGLIDAHTHIFLQGEDPAA